MFYYDITNAETSNGTANTEDTIGRLLTIANQSNARVSGWYCTARETAAGGLIIRMKRMATAGTVGSAKVPTARNPRSPAAELTAFTGSTAGATPTQVLAIGVAGPGGFGGWVALNDDHAINLRPNAGANGNVDLTDIGGAASIDYDYTLEFNEG